MSFYSYLQEEDDNDLITYSFRTSKGSLYYVYFNPYEYNTYTQQYPCLFKLGFGFGFFRTFKSANDKLPDPIVGLTISRIVTDFIEEKGNDVVLLYHCDHSDGKQKGRDKIFTDWYNESGSENEIIMNRVQITREDTAGNKTELFIGYLTPATNANKLEVEEEFSLFGANIISKA